jgi:hypothetical protein
MLKTWGRDSSLPTFAKALEWRIGVVWQLVDNWLTQSTGHEEESKWQAY